jgi:transcriptional regulator with XRE-family HTH domain
VIGEAIKYERERRGWSQRELADRSSLGQSYISKLESNLHPRPSWESLRRIAGAFEIRLEELLRMGGVLELPGPADDPAPEEAPEVDWDALQRIWRRLPASDQALLMRVATALDRVNRISARGGQQPRPEIERAPAQEPPAQEPPAQEPPAEPEPKRGVWRSHTGAR